MKPTEDSIKDETNRRCLGIVEYVDEGGRQRDFFKYSLITSIDVLGSLYSRDEPSKRLTLNANVNAKFAILNIIITLF